MSKKKEAFDYVYYGTACDTAELERFLAHTMTVNDKLEADGRRKTPVCIWGRHGIGKTEVVESLARSRGAEFVAIAPAQFEEMGDLMGMPVVVDDGKATRMAPPEWVPRREGPGVLLIDDVNRADDRILRGLMQLLQNHELAGWKLPSGWQIVLTANPDGGDYSVTPMDDAMLTRMLHVTLRFDVKRWAAWAERTGVDPRGIAFVLTYPETVTGERTTPRTLVQFFDRIAGIADLKKEVDLVTILGESCLDKATVSTFIAFVNQNLEDLVSPEDILGAKKLETVAARLGRLVDRDVKRVDMLAAICTRLVNHLTLRKGALPDKELQNLRDFVKLPMLPEDMRLALAQDLSLLDAKKGIAKIMGDPDVAKLLLRLASSK
ncbi:MAG: AAA family ATPase [Myxococcales bacterium]|nr:AAA family ATPase [Myxococcales bacterium]